MSEELKSFDNLIFLLKKSLKVKRLDKIKRKIHFEQKTEIFSFESNHFEKS